MYKWVVAQRCPNCVDSRLHSDLVEYQLSYCFELPVHYFESDMRSSRMLTPKYPQIVVEDVLSKCGSFQFSTQLGMCNSTNQW